MVGVENGDESQAPCVSGVARGRCWAGFSVAGVTRGELPDGVPVLVGPGIEMIPLQTEHRAFTPVGGTFAGSTRKTERQSGQLTFISELPPSVLPCEASFAFSDNARVANGGQRLLRRDAVVAAAIDGIHGARKTLSVGFHLGSKLTRLDR